MDTVTGSILVLIAVAGGAALGAYVRRRLDESQMGSAQQLSSQIVEDGKKEAETIRKEAELQAKDTVLKAKSEWEKEAKELRRELQGQERRLIQREENLDRKDRVLETRDKEAQQRERELARQEGEIQQREKKAEELVEEQLSRLEQVSGMTSEEARQHLIDTMESQARHDAAKRIKQIEDEIGRAHV